MDAIQLMRWRNRWLGAWFPQWVAQRAATQFLTPRQLPLKAWENKAEQSGAREWVNRELSVLRWPVPSGNYAGRVLLVHGWESRATQMFGFVPALLEQGYEVLALDAPAHGASPGKQSDPWRFAQAILQVQHHYGPLHAVVGHSMGAAATAIAATRGLQTESLVLIAAPESITETLHRFATWTCLPDTCRELFITHIEHCVGMPPQALSVGRALRDIQTRVLLIHDHDDQEVPCQSVHKLARQNPAAKVWITRGLGHRKLMRSVEVHYKVTEFITHRHYEERQAGVA